MYHDKRRDRPVCRVMFYLNSRSKSMLRADDELTEEWLSSVNDGNASVATTTKLCLDDTDVVLHCPPSAATQQLTSGPAVWSPVSINSIVDCSL